ncbi:exported hypothetical protein [uncultured spirochete]|jgi:hypothetical protein|uniref:Uncharacterized protein n=1 Tax=uncultured spirochete TaxID=156406 RepID=A0A3P3XF75_9SPIR|nr:hypothetical protein [Rectinema subterraneum]SLM09885.1 exported hypothetical protein [uncultured spirochete]HCX97284.1 hypothetical protein [Spirochaetaceae bacterium]
MRGRKKYFFDNPRIVAAGAKRKSYIFRALLFASAAISSFLMFSCGTPSAEYLYHPIDFTSETGILRLLPNPSNIDDSYVAALFKGYEIYYHVFDTNDAALNSLSLLQSLSSYDPSYFMSIATSSTYNYYPLLHRFDYLIDPHRPLIVVSNTTNNTYLEFDLNMEINKSWSITSGTDIIVDSVVRNLANNTSADFFVSAYYNSKDQDYTGSDSPKTVYIVFFAVSYGISEASLGNALYSEPVIIDAPVEYTPNS